MSVSALTYPIGPPTPPSARLSLEAIGSQVPRQTSSSTSDANSSATGGGASAVTPPGNPLIKAIGAASESVTTTSLSATAQQAVARQNQALGQLRQLNEQLRTSNHDAAAARLQHLLQEFHALQQFGTASARALAALAKE
ncbi:MAG TPA: hypothetical protein VNY53_06060, partial [Bradyrhizobium sp.]|nr:hypothetical protein [Bradyrhizobium sp.]